MLKEYISLHFALIVLTCCSIAEQSSLKITHNIAPFAILLQLFAINDESYLCSLYIDEIVSIFVSFLYMYFYLYFHSLYFCIRKKKRK